MDDTDKAINTSIKGEIARIEASLANMEDDRRKAEVKLNDANKAVTWAALGLVIGLLLVLLTGDMFLVVLGIILTLAGLLAVITNSSKKNAARKAAASLESEIRTNRITLAGLKGQV